MEVGLGQQLEYVNSMPANDRAYVEDYTSNGYENLNAQLRKGIKVKNLTGSSKLLAIVLDNAFIKVPPVTKTFITYRGISTQDFDKEAKSYISTSYDRKQAVQKAGNTCCLFVITVLPGCKVLPLEGISDLPEEKEILLPRDAALNITLVKVHNYHKTYEMVMMPNSTIPLSVANKNTDQSLGEDVWVARLLTVAEEEIKDFGSSPEDALEYATKIAYKNELVPYTAVDRVLEILIRRYQ